MKVAQAIALGYTSCLHCSLSFFKAVAMFRQTIFLDILLKELMTRVMVDEK